MLSHAATATPLAATGTALHALHAAAPATIAQTSGGTDVFGWLASIGGLLLVAALVTLGYAFTCWIWPFKPCRTCSGTGKRRAPWGLNALRIHARCKGTGLRLRNGRRVYEYLRTEQRHATHR